MSKAEFLSSVTDSQGDLGQTINSLCLGCIICSMNISLVSVTEVLRVLIVYEVFSRLTQHCRSGECN